MDFRRALLVPMILFAIPPTVVAQETATTLIAKLGSRSYQEREAAARSLEALGHSALPVLLKAASHPDQEIQKRTALIIERIEERTVVEEVLQPTLTQFAFRDTPIDEALHAIEKQTGLPIGYVRKSGRPVRVNTGIVPFWQAWRKFCDAAELAEFDYSVTANKLQPIGPEHLERLQELQRRPNFRSLVREWGIFPAFAAPPLNVSPLRISTPFASDDNRCMRVRIKAVAAGTAAKPEMMFVIEVRPIPNLAIVGIPQVEITRFVDGDDRALDRTPMRMLSEVFRKSDQADLLMAYAGEVQLGGFLHQQLFAWPTRTHALKEVHGMVRSQVSVPTRMLEVSDVRKAVGREIQGKQGLAIKVMEAQAIDDSQFRLRLRLDGIACLAPKTPEEMIVRVRPGFTALRGAIDVALERLELRDHQGRKHELIGLGYESIEDGKCYELRLVYAVQGKDAAPLTLALTDRRIVSLRMPFVVRDLRMPEVK